MLQSNEHSLYLAVKNTIMAYSLSDKTVKFNVSCTSDILTYTLIDNSEWLAVTDFNKELLILNSKTGETISTRKVQKKITQLTAIKPPEDYKPYYKEFPSFILLASDKVGEILAYPLPDITKQENMILGHCASIITSFSFSLDNHYIITADRDEKIRISNYPKATIISSYCLNHTKYVFCLSVITDNILISGGGDGKLCLWNVPEGYLLKEYQFNELVGLDTSFSLNLIYYNRKKKLLFVSLLNHPVLYILSVNEDNYDLALVNKVNYESSIISLSFTNDDIVFCSTKGGEYIYTNSINTGERIENEIIKSIRDNLKEYYDVLTNYNNDSQFHGELEKEQLKVRYDPIALKGQTTTLTPYPESK